MFLKVFILLLNLCLIAAQNPFVSCNYKIVDIYYYCELSISNPNGFNNFTSIGGTHLPGKLNPDVQKLTLASNFSSVTTNFPAIICDTFTNINDMIQLWNLGIQRIDVDSFRSCRFMKNLNLVYNNISEIHEDAFVENMRLEAINLDFNNLTTLPEGVLRTEAFLETLTMSNNQISALKPYTFRGLYNLRMLNLLGNRLTSLNAAWFEDLYPLNFLYLNGNQISDLPVGVFKNLKNLMRLYLENNTLTEIGSDSFSYHAILDFVHLMNNRIEAIDELFIDNTAVRVLRMENNICADLLINDETPGRELIRRELATCFENFQGVRCPNDNIAERVCNLENTNQQFYENFNQLWTEYKELRLVVEDQGRRIADLERNSTRTN